ncbi:MAG: diacylglycerol kinase family protein [Clostridia bacterium]|nr:diacylglycerol kinase family protein [Clostridia bacterium]
MKKLIKSFGYAFKGIGYCINQERNFRIHLCFLVYMFGFLTVHDFFEVSKTQFAILIVVSALVIALELVNTGIEKAVDLAVGEEIMPLAKVSKDAAAGAVLIAAIGAVATGLVILYQPSAFAAMADYYKANIPELILLIVTVAISVVFAIAGPSGMLKPFRKKRSNK